MIKISLEEYRSTSVTVCAILCCSLIICAAVFLFFDVLLSSQYPVCINVCRYKVRGRWTGKKGRPQQLEHVAPVRCLDNHGRDWHYRQ